MRVPWWPSHTPNTKNQNTKTRTPTNINKSKTERERGRDDNEWAIWAGWSFVHTEAVCQSLTPRTETETRSGHMDHQHQRPLLPDTLLTHTLVAVITIQKKQKQNKGRTVQVSVPRHDNARQNVLSHSMADRDGRLRVYWYFILLSR